MLSSTLSESSKKNLAKKIEVNWSSRERPKVNLKVDPLTTFDSYARNIDIATSSQDAR